jgi:hypothetical protein
MLKKIILPALLLIGINANADDTKGLVGVSVGYINTTYNAPGTTGTQTDDVGAPSIGLKLGAEGEFYRVFVDASYWHTDQYNHAGTLGAAIQYLMWPGWPKKTFNIFIGLNGGVINTIGDSDTNPYYGADLGVNLNLSDSFGIEIGGRAATVTGTADKDYYATQFYQGYVSAIFKFSEPY